jgi:hypothetical protein
MIPTNTSSITRTGQTEHMKDEAEAITVVEVSGKFQKQQQLQRQ